MVLTQIGKHLYAVMSFNTVCVVCLQTLIHACKHLSIHLLMEGLNA